MSEHALWTEPVRVHGKYAERGLLIWGQTEHSGQLVELDDLREALFAWDAESFYGSAIPIHTAGSRRALYLSAATAVRYLCRAQLLKHTTCRFSTELAAAAQWAAVFEQALLQGAFLPLCREHEERQVQWSVRADEDGRLPGGRVAHWPPRSDDPAARLMPDRWFDDFVYEEIERSPDASDVWVDLCAHHSFLLEPPPHAARWSEQAWLEAIGFSGHAAPYAIGLQLLDPPEPGGQEWQLRLMLVARGGDEIDNMYPYDLDGRPCEEPAPDAWLSSIPQQIEAVCNNWLQLLPWLADPDGTGLTRYPDEQQVWRFLSEGSILLAESGYAVWLPSWWRNVTKKRTRLTGLARSSVGSNVQSAFGLQQIVHFDWRIAIGNIELSEAEFLELADQKRRLLFVQGQWLLLDPDTIQQLRRKLKYYQKAGGVSLRDMMERELLQNQAPQDDIEWDDEPYATELVPDSSLRSLFTLLRSDARTTPTAVPAALKGELRSYQLKGMSWLRFMQRYGLGCCLADDMGLGKTIQFIAYLLSRQEEGALQQPALLICPTSVLGNWRKELERFAPNLRVHMHYGPNRYKGDDAAKALADVDIMLTSYQLAHMDAPLLQQVQWSCICLDEAQHIKNAYTKQAIAIRSLNAEHRIAMTGTPIENRLTELWSIFEFLNPGYLGSLNRFRVQVVVPIERNNDTEAQRRIQLLVQPFLLRRVKHDPSIMLDLPGKQENKVYIPLTAEQSSLYESLVQELLNNIDKISVMERRGMILSSLTRFKQLCDHPLLLSGRDVRGMPVSSASLAEGSLKLVRLLDMIAEVRRNGEKCLIFTQFVQMGEMIRRYLQRELNETVLYMHGGVPREEREEMIQLFQQPTEEEAREQPRNIFVLSLRTGGTGLNLTAANHVFHYDRWWNPAVENQATDRVYRIGQQRNVQIHKFITLGTLEERIDELIERKLQLSDSIIGGSDRWMSEMSTEELRSLLLGP